MSIDYQSLKSQTEAILFVSGDGLSIREIADGLGQESDVIETVLHSLIDDYQERNGGLMIQEISGRFRMVTAPDQFSVLQNFIQYKKKHTLSKSMLETLAIIAYKQPITLFEIEEIRGVNSRTLVTGLMQRKLIKVTGQKDVPGKPGMYGTTKEFLNYFGLNNLQDLPAPKDVKELNFEEL